MTTHNPAEINRRLAVILPQIILTWVVGGDIM